MTEDPLEAVTRLRKKIDQARVDLARKEAQAEQAEVVWKDAVAKLRDFGCASVEEAKEETKRLRASLTEVVEKIEAKLREAGE